MQSQLLSILTQDKWIPIVCALILLYGFIKGWRNGLIKEICSSVGFLIGCALAFYAHTKMGLSLGWTLFVCLLFPLVLGMIASLFSFVLEHIFIIGKLNKLLGALVGCVKYGLLIGFILLIIDKVEEWKKLLF